MRWSAHVRVILTNNAVSQFSSLVRPATEDAFPPLEVFVKSWVKRSLALRKNRNLLPTFIRSTLIGKGGWRGDVG